jgi:hypothetical protein
MFIIKLSSRINQTYQSNRHSIMPASMTLNCSKLKTGILLLGVGFLMASCSWFGKKEIAAKVPCPHVAVISDADLFARFQAGKKWTSNTVLYESQITGIKSACDFRNKKKQASKKPNDKKDKTPDGPRTLVAAITVSFATRINKNHVGRKAELEYFVAITDRNANVLNKNTFKVVPPKPKKRNKTSANKGSFIRFTDKPVRLKIPLKAGQSGHDFMIFTGFQLTKEQLELNRKRRRTPEEFGIETPKEDTQGF